MLYSEFIDRTGAPVTAEHYHQYVEPRYYTYPGDKDEFCRDWLVKQLGALTEMLCSYSKCKREGEVSEANTILYQEAKKLFADYSTHLAKIASKF